MHPDNGLATLALLLTLGGISTPATAEPGVAPEDQLDLVTVDRRVIAVSGRNGATFEATLELDERVLHMDTQGLIGVAATNVRLLGASSGAGRFRTLRYRVEEREQAPPRLLVADRVVLVQLGHRIVALGATSRDWAELTLGPREELRSTHADANVGAIVTDRRAVAFSPASGGFVQTSLAPGDSLETLSLEPSSVTLVTPRRVLIFHAGGARWTELRRRNRR